MMRRMIWTLGMLVLCTFSQAAIYEVDGIFYTLQEDGTAKVVAPGDDGEGGSSVPIGFSTGYKGDIVVPETVVIAGESRPVTAVADYAFMGATSLTSVTLPSTVVVMGDTPFANSVKLASITVADDNPAFCSDDDVLFNKSRTILIACPAAKVGDYAIPATVDSIANSAFYGCGKLTAITLPPSVIRMGVYVFRECSEIQSIVIPEGVQVIRNGAFYGCRKMKTVALPSTLSTIESTAFYYCQSLQIVTLPEGLQTIGSSAFEECVSLSNITLNEGLQIIGSWAFSNTKLSNVIIPSTVSAIGKAPFSACMLLETIEVKETNIHYCSIDGVLLDADATHIICCPAGKRGDYVMPSTVTEVGNAAFFSCRQLTSVEMSPILDNIGNTAFNGCWALTNVRLPQSLRVIGDDAFKNCSELSSLTCYAMVPPTATTNTFLVSIYNKPLYVPSRRVATYKKAAVWKYFKSILPIPEGMCVTAYDAFPDALTKLDIALDVAETGVASYAFDLLLPEGVTPAVNSNGGVMCSFSSRHQGTPLFTIVPLEDNAWHVTVTMGDGSSLTGHEGEVMSLYLDVAANVAPGDYSAMLDNPVVLLADAYRVVMDYVSFDLGVKAGILGDVNQDGEVSVVDVTVLVSQLLGGYQGNFVWQLGDINHDGDITVADVTGLVNIILKM